MTQQKENKQMGWHPNRSYLQFNGDIVLDSCFPAGNISSANIVNYNPLIIEIQGNTDISFDIQAKYWLYFRIRGYRRERSIKFIMKNANHLRKFIGQSKYRPYMVYKQDEEAWQAVPSPIQITLMENGQIQGSFTFQSQKYAKQKKINKSVHELYPSRQHKCSTGMTGDIKKGICYFATYYPYTYDDLNSFILKMTNSFPKQEPKNQSKNNNKVYFNEENLVYSYQRRKVSLITITSTNNIDSFTQKQPVINQEIFPNPKDRPFKLKNCPIIMLSARVHPSETSSSFFIQGFIQFLTSNSKASMILRQLFIFQIVPMLNPDGVEHGNFRFDHQLKNLNRYYGQSSIQKTPSIRGAQLLINYFKNNCNPYSLYTIQFETSNSRLFMYVDVHGHTSAIPSFIYGNHSDKLEHMIENKLFCKFIEANFMEGGFSKQMCQFSKKNMTIQEKYDDYSKLCSGRVFAGMSQRPQQSTFHSYTMQVLPYSDEYLRRKSDNQQRLSAIQYAKCLGKSFAKSILNLLNINSQSTLNDEQIQKWKKIVHKQSMKQLSRNNFMFKRSQINERSSYSELSKPKNSIFQKQTPVYYDYSIRWFNNQSFLKSLLQRSQLINQPKICKFFSPLATKFKLQLPIYLHNFQTRHIRKHESQSKRVRVDERIFTELSDANKKAQLSGQEQKQSILIFKHKQRGRVQTKINKQNLQLNEEYIELITKMKSPEDKQKKQISNKYQYKQKNHTDITQRYQKQILLKLNDKGLNNNAIINRREKKQRKNFKSKINPRLQTETIAHQVQRQILSSQKIINLHKNTSKHLIRQKGGPNSPLQSNLIQFNPRSSFIQEFLQKGNDQKINRQFKNRCNEQLKAKMNKYQSSIKDHVEQQQKKILPVLRRNKIFTIVGSNNPIVDFNQWKCYNSIHPSRKRANTLEQQTNIEQTIFKTKKLLALHKKQEIIRQKSKNSQINYDLRL